MITHLLNCYILMITYYTLICQDKYRLDKDTTFKEGKKWG